MQRAPSPRVIDFQVGPANDPDADYDAAYSYDGATGRLSRVTGPWLPADGSVYGAYYIYMDDSDLLAELAFKDDDDVQAETTRTYEDNRDLIKNLTHRWRPNGSNDLISGYTYVNDELARRSSVVNSGEAFGQRAQNERVQADTPCAIADRHADGNGLRGPDHVCLVRKRWPKRRLRRGELGRFPVLRRSRCWLHRLRCA